MTVTAPPPIDPFPSMHDGVYRDGLVEVRSCGGVLPRRSLRSIRTPHFDVQPLDGRIGVAHRVPPAEVDDDLAGLLAEELFGPGWLRGTDLFERIFTGVVLTSAPDPAAGWELFYRNTLARLDDLVEDAAPPAGDHGTLAGYAPVYGHVDALLDPGTVLELGSCFGFLSLRLARRGRAVVASDVNPGTVDVLSRMAPRLGIELTTVAADAARMPYPPRCSDNVLLIHLLEHLEAEHGTRVVAEAVRLAARRVVVGVPLETEADETWGHVRTVSLADLEAWGALSGHPFEVHEHHGGWLVIDTS